MLASESATYFLARLAPASAPWDVRTVRIVTRGAAPGPDAAVEEIPDPFAAARAAARRGEGFDVGRAVRSVEPVPGGLSGAMGRYVLAPPLSATKVFGVGRNFRAHAEELGNAVPAEPLVFFKPPSCLVASGTPVELPPGDHRVDYEGEWVVVVGRRLRRASAAEAAEAVCALCLGNDVSCRDLQRSDGQWTRAKGFDTFGPVGPVLRMVDGFDALPADARLRTFVGDELRQDAPRSAMVFDAGDVLAFLSDAMTLEPGDAVFLGTPSGVGPLAAGQVVRVECSGLDLGRLVNPVVAAAGGAGPAGETMRRHEPPV